MKVVYLTHTAKLSGAEIGLVRLIQAAAGLNAHVILPEEGPLIGALTAAGAHVEVIPLPQETVHVRREALRAQNATLARHALITGHYSTRVAKHLRLLKPDLVHTTSLKSGVYGVLAARLARTPSIWHLHDRLADDYLPAAAARVMRGLVGFTPNGIIAPSQVTLDVLRWTRPGVQTAVIPLPVPYPARPRPLRDRVNTVGMIGRITPWKGQALFLQAFAQALGKSEVRARIIGAPLFGEDEYFASLKQLAASLGLKDKVDFVGFEPDISRALQELDILVHCSILPDPLATVVLEGLASGTPVISTNAGGTAEFLVDRESALLHRRADLGDLTRCLRLLAADSALRERISVGGRLAAERFRPAQALQDMYEFYYELVGFQPAVQRQAALPTSNGDG